MKNLMIICICVVCLFCASNGDCKTDLEKLRESTALRMEDIETIVLLYGVTIEILISFSLVHEWQIRHGTYLAMIADKNTPKEERKELITKAWECIGKIEQYKKDMRRLEAKRVKMIKESEKLSKLNNSFILP